MDFKNFEKIENKIIIAFGIVLAVYIFFDTTMTVNGVAQPQWLAGITGVAFMATICVFAYGAAWVLNWLINAGWRK